MNLARNQIVTMDTQDDMWEVIAVSPSGNMVATQSKQSIKLQDTVTLEVIRCIDYENKDNCNDLKLELRLQLWQRLEKG